MKVLEVVHLRMAGEDPEWLAEMVGRAIRDAEGAERIRVFRHGSVDSDLLVHLERDDLGGGPKAGKLGTRLAELLKMYGMVEHSVWCGIEEE